MAKAAGKSEIPRLLPDGARTAHRTVTDRMREAILSGELPGGLHLVQSDLAQSLGVSVTPVREALRDLVGEGLIDFDAYRGAIVHPPSLDELEEIYELRRLLTPSAVREAVKNATPEELDQAEQLCRAMEKTNDASQWLECNRQFHRLLDTASRRPRFQEILGRLADLSALYVGVSIGGTRNRRMQANRDHAEMVAAYRDGDVDKAVTLALDHLADTVQIARDRLLNG